jgi:hypothetical protein
MIMTMTIDLNCSNFVMLELSRDGSGRIRDIMMPCVSTSRQRFCIPSLRCLCGSSCVEGRTNTVGGEVG